MYVLSYVSGIHLHANIACQQGLCVPLGSMTFENQIMITGHAHRTSRRNAKGDDISKTYRVCFRCCLPFPRAASFRSQLTGTVQGCPHIHVTKNHIRSFLKTLHRSAPETQTGRPKICPNRTASVELGCAVASSSRRRTGRHL